MVQRGVGGDLIELHGMMRSLDRVNRKHLIFLAKGFKTNGYEFKILEGIFHLDDVWGLEFAARKAGRVWNSQPI